MFTMITSRIPRLYFGVLILCIWPTPLLGATIYSNLFEPGDLYGPDPVGIGAIPVPGFFQYYATNFSVPGQDYRLGMLELPLSPVQGLPEVDVFLMADSGNLPGTVLEQFHVTVVPTPPGALPGLQAIPSVVRPLLLSGHQYWVAATGGTPSTFAVWSLTLFTGDPIGGGASRVIQNGFDLGWVNNPGTRVAALRVSGDPVSAVPEPSTIMLMGGGLIALRRARRILGVKPSR